MNAPRTSLCLECRTVLGPGEHCDAHPRGKVVDLADGAQRTRAVDTVWGPPHLRARQAARAGGVGGGAGGAIQGCGEGCSGCGDVPALDGEAAIALLVIIVAAIAAIALYYLIKWIVHAVREWRARPRPKGSRWAPARGRHALRATIRTASSLTAPLSGNACAAWGVTLVHDRATEGRVMLRDGQTAGLTLQLDDGRAIEVPAGRVRVTGDGSREKPTEPYLRSIDPSHAEADDHAVFPYSDGYEVRLSVGDVVEVVGGLEERFDPTSEAGYREAPRSQLVLAGVPTLVRVT